VIGDGAASDRVTYLIANRNRARYLPACLQSLYVQTDAHWLALICDDASEDDSTDVLAGIADRRIRVLRNETNIGYAATLRRLVHGATTDIVAILDPDDALAPEATARLLAAYADPQAEFVYSRYAVYDDTLTSCRAVQGSAVPPGGTALRDACVGQLRSFRRSTYFRTAGFDPSMEYAEDRDLVYKLEEVTRPIFLDAVLYRYRELPDSQSHDPAKREVGALNVRRARRAALARREIRGVRRLVWEVWVLLDYLAFSDARPRTVRRLATALLRGVSLAGPLRRSLTRSPAGPS
jgi:glycosyltransferase involved in cell wall biosynthesis